MTQHTAPQRPCASRPTTHLRTNNPLALQRFFAVGTLHTNCTGVSLRKATDPRAFRLYVENDFYNGFDVIGDFDTEDQARDYFFNEHYNYPSGRKYKILRTHGLPA